MKDSAAQQPVMEENMSNLTSASGEASASSINKNDSGGIFSPQYNFQNPQAIKKKRNQPGNPDPGAEVIALSPRALLATNRFVCEICNKGFQRDQNLQLHRRGHNLPWKLKQRTSKEIRKKVYICPEITCVHHDPSRALGDLTGIKKHFRRKHGEKKWKCDKCSKKYAVHSDWKAHSKICGTKEYRCDCGTIFSRRDSFITHRAFCDAISEERTRNESIPYQSVGSSATSHHLNLEQMQSQLNPPQDLYFSIKKEQQSFPHWLPAPSPQFQDNPSPNSTYTQMDPTGLQFPQLSATALLQKAAQMGAKSIINQCASAAGGFIRPHHAHMPSDANGFGLDLMPSRDELLYWNKAASMTEDANTGPGAPAGGNGSNIPLPSSSTSLLHDMMKINSPNQYHHFSSRNEFEGSNFEEVGEFGGTWNHSESMKNQECSFNGALGQFSRGNDGMTKDYLGLRPLLSQSQILSMSGLTSCMNSVNPLRETQNPTPKSWQG